MESPNPGRIVSMPERIASILKRCRRRLVTVRAAEAAALAAIVAAPAAAALMAARILLGQYPAAAAGLVALPMAAGGVMAAWPAGRKALGGPRMQWALTALLLGLGAAGAAALAAGALAQAPKDAIVLIVPACSLAGAVAVAVRGTPMSHVAMGLDRKAQLAERLSTAWELRDRSGDTPFIRAVHDQAAAAIAGGRLAGVRFWTRTRATLAALALALVPAAVLLPWAPLESPAALRHGQWRQVAPQAGEAIAAEIQAALAGAATPAELAGTLERMEALARALESGDAAEAEHWEGTVIELEDLAQAIRRFLREGDADPATRQRLGRLLRVLEQAAVDIAAGMGGAGAVPRPIDPETVKLPAPHEGSPAGWATVYDPLYEGRVDPAAGGDDPSAPEAPPVHQAPYDRQWMLARARAARAIDDRQVPWEYRELVEEFFSTRP